MPGEGRPGPDATVTTGNLRGGISEAEAQEKRRERFRLTGQTKNYRQGEGPAVGLVGIGQKIGRKK